MELLPVGRHSMGNKKPVCRPDIYPITSFMLPSVQDSFERTVIIRSLEDLTWDMQNRKANDIMFMPRPGQGLFCCADFIGVDADNFSPRQIFCFNRTDGVKPVKYICRSRYFFPLANNS